MPQLEGLVLNQQPYVKTLLKLDIYTIDRTPFIFLSINLVSSQIKFILNKK